MDHEKEIKALRDKIAYLETQIEALEIRTDGHTQSIHHASDMRDALGDLIDVLLGLADDHSQRIKAIEAHLWPGITRDHIALTKIIGERGKPGAGSELDKRK